MGAKELLRSEFTREAWDQAQATYFNRELLAGRRKVNNAIALDPEGTPDADDSFTIDYINNAYLLAISITDLASFIPKQSPIDTQAQERFQTIYRTGSPKNNIPMMPKLLSEGRFSQSTGGIKPTVTTAIHIPPGPEGEVSIVYIEKTVTDIFRAISNQQADTILAQGGDIKESLSYAREAAKILSQKRRSKAINLTAVPYRSVFSSQPRIVEQTYASSKIIQEFMITHNALLAHLLSNMGVPLLYRNHTPSKNTLAAETQLAAQLQDEAIRTGQEIDEEHLWQRAYFGTQAKGHVGLGLAEYAHFTSPIRRYQDLVNQRVLLSVLSHTDSPYTIGELQELAAHGNMMTRRK